MARKRWTPQTQVTDALLKFREKRKWQLGYRRYVLEGKPSEAYARYFGLSARLLREWFELQFTPGENWENFGEAWQFGHVLPSSCFDYSLEEDLVLCWSFINLRVEPIEAGNTRNGQADLLAARPYFEALYQKTGFSLCRKMLDKIALIEKETGRLPPALADFIITNRSSLEKITTLSTEEFAKLNEGMGVDEILLEREILKKFG